MFRKRDKILSKNVGDHYGICSTRITKIKYPCAKLKKNKSVE